MTRRERRLFAEGLRGHRVIGFEQALRSGVRVVTVEWREGGKRATRSFPCTAEGRRLAKAHAKGTAERLAQCGAGKIVPLTLAELHDRYVTANSHTWAEATRTNYLARWAIFAEIVGLRERADCVTPDTLDDARKKLRTTVRAKTGEPMAPNQVREVLAHVCTIWRWAKQRKLLRENPLADYENKMGKGEGALEIPEYTPDEYARIIAAFDPTLPRYWRAYGVLALAGLTGKRENALLNLTWDSVDVDARVIHWPKDTDKMDEAWEQPMAADTPGLFALLAAWRETIGYTGPYVFPPAHSLNQTGHYTRAAVIAALHVAEKAAGVPPIKYRALHSIKRYVVRSLHDALGGDLMRVGRFVGNKSLAVLRKSYLRERAGELQPAADALALPRRAPEAANESANERQSPPDASKSPSHKRR